jgi:hypothetical protein
MVQFLNQISTAKSSHYFAAEKFEDQIYGGRDMKKMRKLLAMLLTVTMTCALSVTPAFAREGDDDQGGTTQSGSTAQSESTGTTSNAGKTGDGKTALTTLSFVKVVDAPAGAQMTNETFTFTMTPDSTANGEELKGDMKVWPGVVPSGQENLTTSVSTNQNGITDVASTITGYESDDITSGVVYNVSFDLSGLDFSEHGRAVYRYTVVETNDDKSHMTTGGEEYTVDLYVNQDGDIVYEQAINNNSKAKVPIVFKNHLQTTNVTIQKEVKGNLLSQADQETKDFTFVMQIPEGGVELNLTAGAKFKYTKYDRENNETTGYITVGGDQGDAEADWPKDNTFTLKNGEKIVLENIPLGMIFMCKETTESSSGFVVSYSHTSGTYKDKADGNPKTYLTTRSNDVVTFTNTKEEVDTGIILDIMPYVAVILIVAAAGVTTILAKKRRMVR